MTCKEFIRQCWLREVSLSWHKEWLETVTLYHLPAIEERLGGTDLLHISKTAIHEWWTDLSTKKKTAMANKILVTLRHIFNSAVDWGYLQESPVRVKAHKSSPGRVRYLSAEETDRLIKFASPSILKYIIVARYTGARRASLLKLRWDDLDWAKGTITLRRTKNGATTILPVHPALGQHLKTWLLSKDSDYILPRLNPRTITMGVTRAAKKAGIPDFHLHDLRHDFASRLVQAGVGINLIKQAMGHTNIASTMRYAHASIETMTTALRNLE